MLVVVRHVLITAQRPNADDIVHLAEIVPGLGHLETREDQHEHGNTQTKRHLSD